MSRKPRGKSGYSHAVKRAASTRLTGHERRKADRAREKWWRLNRPPKV